MSPAMPPPPGRSVRQRAQVLHHQLGRLAVQLAGHVMVDPRVVPGHVLELDAQALPWGHIYDDYTVRLGILVRSSGLHRRETADLHNLNTSGATKCIFSA